MSKCNVIIWESQKGFSNKLREYFQSKGVTSHLTSNFKDLLRSARNMASPIILLELPDRTNAAHQFLKDLNAQQDLFVYPLIVVGNNARSYENYLNETFKIAINFNKPASNIEIMDSINYLLETFEFPKSGHIASEALSVPESHTTRAEPEAASAESQATTVNPVTEIAETELIIPANELYASFSSIPDLFFGELSKYNLLSRDLQGKHYIAYSSEAHIDKNLVNSPDPLVSNALEEINASLSKLALIRMHRVAFLSAQLLNAICTNAGLVADAKCASILMNWSLIKGQKVYLKKDFIMLKSKSFRKELCSKLKDSAMKCALDLKQERIAEIISKTGKLIGLEEAVSDDEVTMAASVIAAVDMIDRACWQNNHFSPRAAYKIMVMAKTGELSEFHPAVLCCIIKVLSEAIASNLKLFMIPRKLKKNKDLLEAAKRTRELVAAEGERKVELDQLAPGMRLSRPLVAFDGREILEEDLILDQDLIWRIWQLSLVRPLNAPLVIEKQTAEEPQ